MGTSGASIRNQIDAAVLARFQGINGTGNYVTNLSATDCVRLFRKAPFTFAEIPEVSINSIDEDTTQGPLVKNGMGAQTGSWQRDLKYEVYIAVSEKAVLDANGNVVYQSNGSPQWQAGGSGDSNLVIQFLKDAFADFDFALGVDRFWTVAGTRLALNTVPGKNSMIYDHDEFYIGLGCYEFTIQYRIPAFSPNTVAVS